MIKNLFFIPIASFLFGMTVPLRALKLILTHPSLFLLSLVPVVLSFGVSLFFYNQFQSKLYLFLVGLILPTELTVSAHFFSQTFSQIIQSFFSWVAKAVSFFLGSITFFLLIHFIHLPFNDFLAEASEKYVFPPLTKVRYLSIRKRMKLMLMDLFKTFFLLFLQFFLFFIHYFPFLQLFSIPFTFLLITFQYISYPQTRRNLGILIGIRFLKNHFFASVGFGMSIALLLNLPWISCFLVPLAVVGGTLLVARAQNNSPSYFPLS